MRSDEIKFKTVPCVLFVFKRIFRLRDFPEGRLNAWGMLGGVPKTAWNKRSVWQRAEDCLEQKEHSAACRGLPEKKGAFGGLPKVVVVKKGVAFLYKKKGLFKKYSS